MSYLPPTSHIMLAIRSTGPLQGPSPANLSVEDAETIIAEAGRFAAERMAPLNRVGDLHPAKLVGGEVETPPGFRDIYQEWCAGGWNSLSGPAEFGGQGLSTVMAAACTELWNASCMAFALCPLLTTGAVEAIAAHGSAELKQRYLPKLISGEWSGTMNLTEPQAGSDLSNLRCRAQRHDDGSYRISGSKIFITYGEQDFTSNIVHLVLARLPDAPPGSKGISLFLVPKILPDGTRNDLRCHSLEHKLGIGGSPTCAMVYGDNGGATGWLIGEENRGLACMFTMMNNARLLVGVQGVALAEAATQRAIAFAKERRQGRAPGMTDGASAIIHHPDVRRMLVEMRAKTAAARMLCMATASAIEASHRADSESERKNALTRAALLTPLAKAYATDIAVEVTSLAIQVHGGMGFIEETGVAQLYRDARILPIYEGTNGIQAIDLVTRKLTPEGIAAVMQLLASCRSSVVLAVGEACAADIDAQIRKLLQAISAKSGSVEALAAAVPVLRALAAAIAGGYLARGAERALDKDLDGQAKDNARYVLNVELPAALTSAQAWLAEAQIVGKARFE